MDRSEGKATGKGIARSTIVLILIFGAIVLAALACLVGVIVVFGSVDEFFQYVIRAALQARYNRIIAGYSLWPWAFWIFFWGFVALLVFVLLIVLYLTLLEPAGLLPMSTGRRGCLAVGTPPPIPVVWPLLLIPLMFK